MALIATLWLGLLVFKIHPDLLKDLIITNGYIVPIAISTGTFGLWLYIWTKQKLRTYIWTASAALVLIFTRIGIGHLLNIGLIIGVALSADYYLRKDTM